MMLGFDGVASGFMLIFLLMALVVIAIVAVIQAIDRAVQRRRQQRLRERVQAGRCRRCGYDLAGLEEETDAGVICPECGNL